MRANAANAARAAEQAAARQEPRQRDVDDVSDEEGGAAEDGDAMAEDGARVNFSTLLRRPTPRRRSIVVACRPKLLVRISRRTRSSSRAPEVAAIYVDTCEVSFTKRRWRSSIRNAMRRCL